VYDISLFIPEGICLAAFVAFVACGYTMQFLICVCLLCFLSENKEKQENQTRTQEYEN
jgi:hypothetical protein